jgi:hypothetical protein
MAYCGTGTPPQSAVTKMSHHASYAGCDKMRQVAVDTSLIPSNNQSPQQIFEVPTRHSKAKVTSVADTVRSPGHPASVGRSLIKCFEARPLGFP